MGRRAIAVAAPPADRLHVSGLLGAFVYDGERLGRLLGLIGIDVAIPQNIAIKLPLVLSLGFALCALAVALGMVEPPGGNKQDRPESLRAAIGSAFRRTWEAALWIWRSAWPLILILSGLVFDSMVRLFYTVAASYYRLIDIPEAYFGVIGMAAVGLSIATSWILERMVKTNRPRTNFLILAALAMAGVISLAFPVAYWGALFVLPLVLAMRMTHFFISSYLNAATDSKNRATVLSFRGLALNAGYGIVTLLYGIQSGWIARSRGLTTADAKENEEVFAQSLTWWPSYFLVTLLLLGMVAFWLQRRSPAKFTDTEI